MGPWASSITQLADRRLVEKSNPEVPTGPGTGGDPLGVVRPDHTWPGPSSAWDEKAERTVSRELYRRTSSRANGSQGGSITGTLQEGVCGRRGSSQTADVSALPHQRRAHQDDPSVHPQQTANEEWQCWVVHRTRGRGLALTHRRMRAHRAWPAPG